jgi:hypothetical protein
VSASVALGRLALGLSASVALGRFALAPGVTELNAVALGLSSPVEPCAVVLGVGRALARGAASSGWLWARARIARGRGTSLNPAV